MSLVNQHMHSLREERPEAVYGILRYLEVIPSQGWYFEKIMNMGGYRSSLMQIGQDQLKTKGPY